MQEEEIEKCIYDDSTKCKQKSCKDCPNKPKPSLPEWATQNDFFD